MFKRPHHQLIERLLRAFDAQILADAECFFGGGTAIVLMLDEYRESADVDFLCASQDGYRKLRNMVSLESLGPLLKEPIRHLREVRTDQYGIRTFLSIDDVPIKIEIVREARIDLQGINDSAFPIPYLSREDMFAEKLLANTDRALDRAVLSRDIIDIAMMARYWGDIPRAAFDKAYGAYGNAVVTMFEGAINMIGDRRYFEKCLRDMSIDGDLTEEIVRTLVNQLNLITGQSRLSTSETG
jgi:hypothetical protein